MLIYSPLSSSLSEEILLRKSCFDFLICPFPSSPFLSSLYGLFFPIVPPPVHPPAELAFVCHQSPSGLMGSLAVHTHSTFAVKECALGTLKLTRLGNLLLNSLYMFYTSLGLPTVLQLLTEWWIFWLSWMHHRGRGSFGFGSEQQLTYNYPQFQAPNITNVSQYVWISYINTFLLIIKPILLMN